MAKITYNPGPNGDDQVEFRGVLLAKGETLTTTDQAIIDEALQRRDLFEVSGDRARDLGDTAAKT